MTAEERARHDLLAGLEDVLGPERAAKLMESLPNRPWNELTTKDDLAPVKADIAGLKTDVAELKTDVAGLKTDVAGLKTDVAGLKTDVAELGRDLGHLAETVELRFEANWHRTEAFLRTQMTAQTRTLVFTVAGATVASFLANTFAASGL